METMNYWISARIADGDTFEMVSIRAVAASISYEQTTAWSASTYLFELPTTRIGRDPTHVATETIKLLSGHGLIEDLPAEVRALLSDKRTELQSNRPAIEWYPPGAKTLYLKLLGVEDAVPGETYELVHLYLLKLAEVQANLNLQMDGNESLRWIVDHWDLGDVGCAQALDPSHRRQATHTKRGH